ncbi:MAG: MurR/RpiR family transcriptional regulator [Candidatus Methylomirabilia bacterium]
MHEIFRTNRNKSEFLRRLQGESFSPKHGAIARYLAQEYRAAAFLTAAELAATTGVSEATVTRFALSLGYRGYPELRRHLHRIVKEELTSLDLLALPLRKRGRPRDALTSVVETEMRNLSALVREMPREELSRVVKGMLVARRIYVVGHMASAALARSFGYSLSKIHDDVVTITEAGRAALDAFRSVPATACLIAIGFPRYPRDTLELMEFAREEDVTIVALTDSFLSPLAKRADLVLTVQTDLVSFVDSHCAPLALLTALLVEWSLRARERTEAMLDRFERLARRHALFHSSE